MPTVLRVKKIPLFWLIILFLFIGLSVILVFSPKPFSGTIVNNSLGQDLFIKPVQNFIRESPEMSFIQKNSLVGVSSPAIIAPQVLGALLGSIEVEPESRKQIIEYIFEPGDNLSVIAKKFDISLNTILWANDLSINSIIEPGQKLIILPVSGVIYHVQKGDTLSQIAKTYKGKVEEIIAFNELSSEGDIYIGDILIIPNGQMPVTLSQIVLTPLAASYFIFPCEGKITKGLHFFNAVDIANKCGKPVVAVASGKVQRAGRIWIGGNRVTILHPNGVVSYYGHLSTILVKPGQTVKAGDIIGYIGNTGYTLGATGCHLHFGIRGAKNFLANYPVGSYLSWKK